MGYTAGIRASTVGILKRAALDTPVVVEQPHLYIIPVADGRP